MHLPASFRLEPPAPGCLSLRGCDMSLQPGVNEGPGGGTNRSTVQSGRTQDRSPSCGKKSGVSTRIEIEANCSAGSLEIEVRDDGRGLPEGFDGERTTGIGLNATRPAASGALRKSWQPLPDRQDGRRRPHADPDPLPPGSADSAGAGVGSDERRDPGRRSSQRRPAARGRPIARFAGRVSPPS